MHPSLEGLLRWFNSDHLQEGRPKDAVKWMETVAYKYANEVTSSAELTAFLRKLLEAKDCLVRAIILMEEKASESSNPGEEDSR